MIIGKGKFRPAGGEKKDAFLALHETEYKEATRAQLVFLANGDADALAVVEAMNSKMVAFGVPECYLLSTKR